MRLNNSIVPKFVNTVFYLYSLLVIFFIVVAYKGLIPYYFGNIPFYDKVGHFLLIGFYSYILNLVLKRQKINFKNFSIPLAPLVIGVIFTIEECFQSLSPVRTFDLLDLACDFAGIYVFYFIDQKITKSTISNKH